jgi:hypothetical protein
VKSAQDVSPSSPHAFDTRLNRRVNAFESINTKTTPCSGLCLGLVAGLCAWVRKAKCSKLPSTAPAVGLFQRRLPTTNTTSGKPSCPPILGPSLPLTNTHFTTKSRTGIPQGREIVLYRSRLLEKQHTKEVSARQRKEGMERSATRRCLPRSSGKGEGRLGHRAFARAAHARHVQVMRACTDERRVRGRRGQWSIVLSPHITRPGPLFIHPSNGQVFTSTNSDTSRPSTPLPL